MPTTKRLPPFGRRAVEKIRTGKIKNGINIYPSWHNARTMPHGVCFPHGAKPDDFNWTFLAEQDISLINTNGASDFETLKDLAALLIRSGAKRVGLVDPIHPLLWFEPVREAA